MNAGTPNRAISRSTVVVSTSIAAIPAHASEVRVAARASRHAGASVVTVGVRSLIDSDARPALAGRRLDDLDLA